MLFDEETRTFLPPSATQSQVTVLTKILENCTPSRKTELGTLLQTITGRFKRRGLLVIVSDLFTDLEKFYDGLNRLRFGGNEVLILQVLDRDEVELPFEGPTVFRDIEGEEELYAEPGGFRKAYRQAMKEFLDGVTKECGSRNYDHARFFTDEPLASSLSYFLHARQQIGGRA